MRVSVIIPVYNAEAFLEKAVRSAVHLSQVDEILLIEDGSPDQSLAICLRLAQEFSKVRVLQHPDGENKGAAITRNLGLQEAKGDYIAFLDADDFYLPHRFDQDEVLFNTHADIDGVYNAIGVYYYSDKAKEKFCTTLNIPLAKSDQHVTTIHQEIPSNELFDHLYKINKPYVGYFTLDGLTVKTSALKKYGLHFIDHLRLHQDTEFMNRMSYYLKLIPSGIHTPVACRGVHEENRITGTGTSYKLYENRYKLFSEVYAWAQQEGLEAYRKEFFQFHQIRYDLLREKSTVKRIFRYLGYAFRMGPQFFAHQRSSLAHSALFTAKWLREPFLKCMGRFNHQNKIRPTIGL